MSPDRQNRARAKAAELEQQLAANYAKLSAATSRMDSLRRRRPELEVTLQRAVAETGDVDSDRVTAATEELRANQRDFDQAEERYRTCDAVEKRIEGELRLFLREHFEELCQDAEALTQEAISEVEQAGHALGRAKAAHSRAAAAWSPLERTDGTIGSVRPAAAIDHAVAALRDVEAPRPTGIERTEDGVARPRTGRAGIAS